MAKKKNINSVKTEEKKNLSFEERLAQQASNANKIKKSLLREIENMPLEGELFDSFSVDAKRANIDAIYKIRNAMNIIRRSQDKEVIALAVSSDITKDFIMEGIKLEEVFNTINLKNQRISRKGKFEEMKDGIDAAIETKKSVENAMEALKNSITDAFRKGFGSRRSIEEVAKMDKRVKINQAINEISEGALPKDVQNKLELTDADMGNVLNRAIEPYIESHKAEIVKATIKKVRLAEIAESLDIKAIHKIKDAVDRWAETDAKLKKALEDIKVAIEAERAQKVAEKRVSKEEPETKAEEQ